MKEYDGRYWIYTNVIGADNDYGFKSSSKSAGTCVIEIIPIESESGNGYVLLSAPAKYNYLSVKSGEYTTMDAAEFQKYVGTYEDLQPGYRFSSR